MGKNGFYLGVESKKKMPFFQKIFPKKRNLAPNA